MPGREKYKDKYQTPRLGITPSGDREVLDHSLAELALNDAAAAASVLGPLEISVNETNDAPDDGSHDRDILDHMIERMQREQDERIVAAGGEPMLLSPNASNRSAPELNVSANHTPAPPAVQRRVQPTEKGEEVLKVSVWTKRSCICPLGKHLVR